MRLLYHLHGFPPHHNAGAELYALELLRWFRDRGHQTEIIISPSAPFEPGYDGFTIRRRGPLRWLDRAYNTADVAFTHLDETPHAVAAAHRTGTPLVHVLHNDRQLAYHHVTHPALAVANTRWLADTLPAGTPTLTVFPPCPPPRYQTLAALDAGAPAVLFVNPTLAKGAPLVYELARRHPRQRFLIVAGGYGHQLRPPSSLPNVDTWRNTPDPRLFYAETLINLTPSIYESFGRVPAEAAASGIPTIARPLPGIIEALDTAALYTGAVPTSDLFHAGTDTERLDFLNGDVDAWDQALTELLGNPDRYTELSAAATVRAARLWTQTQTQLETLEDRIAHL